MALESHDWWELEKTPKCWSLVIAPEVCGAGKSLGFPIPIWLKGHCPVYSLYVVKALDILVSVFNKQKGFPSFPGLC